MRMRAVIRADLISRDDVVFVRVDRNEPIVKARGHLARLQRAVFVRVEPLDARRYAVLAELRHLVVAAPFVIGLGHVIGGGHVGNRVGASGQEEGENELREHDEVNLLLVGRP
jgi:hypothetical protein